MMARLEDYDMALTAEAKNAVKRVAETLCADILLFNAPIERPSDMRMIRRFESRKCRPNVFMILVTAGGDPDAAYRISRCLQNHYEKVICCVSSVCKSAGTLILLGAHELVFGEHGEIGPLDIQMAKKDDLWESESGLTVMTALNALHENAQDAFDHFLVALTTRSGGRITVRTASEVAAKLTQALYSPISEQIDPIHLGEIYRSMSIADHYGRRLISRSKNCDLSTLGSLISDYPSHGFVIDGTEASTLFKNVRNCSPDETILLREIGGSAHILSELPTVKFITDDIEETSNETLQEVLERPTTAGIDTEAAGHVPSNGDATAAATSAG
jgi:hypothetical protein